MESLSNEIKEDLSESKNSELEKHTENLTELPDPDHNLKVEFEDGNDVYIWARASRTKESRIYHIGFLSGDIDPKWHLNIQDRVEREYAKEIVMAVMRDYERGLLTIKHKRLSKSRKGKSAKFAYIAERMEKVKIYAYK